MQLKPKLNRVGNKVAHPTLAKYFLLSICCLGLNGCTAGAFLGAVAVGSVLLTDSNGCHSGCSRSPYRSEDGKHTFNNSGETKWYDNLSQNEKDLLNRNSEICLKWINNEQKKGMEVAALIKSGWQCHIEL
ncbi:MAG: hypothetical protein J6U05_05235 [Neisseriaceae bacterium]|nr:hypothetical protein [Neisseriaceae bacterium]MBO7554584.1 hypothetical protein [Neisseriaceae bacterium]